MEKENYADKWFFCLWPYSRKKREKEVKRRKEKGKEHEKEKMGWGIDGLKLGEVIHWWDLMENHCYFMEGRKFQYLGRNNDGRRVEHASGNMAFNSLYIEQQVLRIVEL
jgi:hypothetical protein